MRQRRASVTSDSDDDRLRELLSRVRRALDHHGRSQSDLARTLGVRAATVSDWFTGRSAPSGPILLRLPEALGVRTGWLFTGEGPVHD
jgi:transcriptional regulator with XRE-family HTH domain